MNNTNQNPILELGVYRLLRLCIRKDDVAKFKKIFKKDVVDPNSQMGDFNRNTLLIWACYKEAIKISKFLIKKGADVNLSNRWGDRPLHCLYSSPEIAKLLIKKGADVNAVNEVSCTPLHCANYCAETTKLLIDAGADVTARDKRRFTPLHKAIHPEVAELLIDAGADIEAIGDGLQTPLFRLAHSRWSEIDVLDFLIKKGADVNACEECGRSPLHVVDKLGGAKVLVYNGADINLKDKRGATPLLYRENNEQYLDRTEDIENNQAIIEFIKVAGGKYE